MKPFHEYVKRDRLEIPLADLVACPVRPHVVLQICRGWIEANLVTYGVIGFTEHEDKERLVHVYEFIQCWCILQ